LVVVVVVVVVVAVVVAVVVWCGFVASNSRLGVQGLSVA